MERRNPNPTFAKFSLPGEQGRNGSQDNEWSELTQDPTTSYNYRVIQANNPDAEFLEPAGAQIWTPDQGLE